MSSAKPIQKLDSIQALRGLAALLVLVFHLAELYRTHTGLPTGIATAGPWGRGYAGVDLFFVISGFIMVYVTQNTASGLRHAGQFLRKRIWRIYPLWWVWASVMGLYFLWIYGLPADPDRAAAGGGAGLYLLRSYLLLPQAEPPILGLGWTLIHEMYFYVIFAGLLLLPRRFMPAALGVWAGAVALGYYAGWAEPLSTTLLALAVAPVTFEFLLGAGAGLIILQGRTGFPKSALWIGGAGLLAGGVFMRMEGADLLIWGRVAVFALPCALMVYGAAALDISGRTFVPRWSVALGDWSYSLYLSHIFVVSALLRLLPDIPFALYVVLGFILSLIVAAISYHIIERPVMQWAQRRRALVSE